MDSINDPFLGYFTMPFNLFILWLAACDEAGKYCEYSVGHDMKGAGGGIFQCIVLEGTVEAQDSLQPWAPAEYCRWVNPLGDTTTK
jgi:hypothetical protein